VNVDAEDVNLISEAVADRLQRGQLAITRATQDELRQWGGHLCPPLTVGWGANYYTLQGMINRDGSLQLELRDNSGTTAWRGELRDPL
jgi:hypothetical protein